LADLDQNDASQVTILEPRARFYHHPLAVVLALLGGVLGIIGAIVTEIQSGGFLLLPIIGAPIIEEAMKPAGVYLLMARWPQALRGRLYTAVLAAISGLSFGLVEAFVYITLYVSDPPDWFVTYRFTAPLALHTGASFIVGLGITRNLWEWTQGREPLAKSSRNLFITAVSIHAIFNTTAIALALSGVLDVE